MRGRSGRQVRRTTHPAIRATTATATRLKKAASRNAGTMAVPSPEIGWRWMRRASSTVKTAKAGHIQAPRIRQRIRELHIASMGRG